MIYIARQGKGDKTMETAFMYKKLGISPEVYNFGEEILASLKERFEQGAREGQELNDPVNRYHDRSPSPPKNTSLMDFVPFRTRWTSGDISYPFSVRLLTMVEYVACSFL
jgi:hypothetical protein